MWMSEGPCSGVDVPTRKELDEASGMSTGGSLMDTLRVQLADTIIIVLGSYRE